MKPMQFAAVVLASCYLSGIAFGQEPDRPTEPPIGVCLIPEFGFIPEVQTWQSYKLGELSPEEIRNFEREWKREWHAKVAPLITPATVRRMIIPRDRFGIKDDTHLEFSVKNWTPVTYADEPRRHVVFQARGCELPRITAIRRSITVYCLYDTVRKSISRVSLIVQGDRDG